MWENKNKIENTVCVWNEKRKGKEKFMKQKFNVEIENGYEL